MGEVRHLKFGLQIDIPKYYRRHDRHTSNCFGVVPLNLITEHVPVTLVVTFSARVVCSEIVGAVDDGDSEMKQQ